MLPMTSPLALAIDLGTSGPKAAVVAADGTLLGSAVRSVRTTQIGESGAEQDPDEIWAAVVAAAREALGQAGSASAAVAAVACVSQYSSIVPVGRDGRPVGPLVLWLDGRGAPYGLALYGAADDAIPRFVERHGALPLPSGADSLAHMLHLKNDRPEIYERTHAFVEAMDYLNFRFTGELTSNLGSAFMMLLADNRDPASPAWDPSLVELSGIDPARLPPLGPQRGRVGALRADVAAELGLAAGTAVFASMNDTQAAALGTGTFREGRGALNLGTTCQVLAHRGGKATDFESHFVSLPSPVKDRWLILAENGLGGGALRHLVEGVLFTRGPLGDTVREAPYGGVEAALASTVPGAEGALFLPWLAGAQFPEDDPLVRGGFLGLSLETRPEHLVRAVMEGVALNLCAAIEPVERFAEQAFADLALSGGGALSSGWAQILADASGRPVRQLANPRYVNTLAAALLVFDELGVTSLDHIDAFIPTERTFEPRADVTALYASLAAKQRAALAAAQAYARA